MAKKKKQNQKKKKIQKQRASQKNKNLTAAQKFTLRLKALPKRIYVIIAAAAVIVIALIVVLVVTNRQKNEESPSADSYVLSESQAEWNAFLPNVAAPEQEIQFMSELSSENVRIFLVDEIYLPQAQHFAEHVTFGGFDTISDVLSEDGSQWMASFKSQASVLADAESVTINVLWTSDNTMTITAEKS